ncbi:thioredoxin family protein [Deinococcus depolymerans]|uniref:Thioredoxin domain-containing protein n=1 Tax=Deinococcus depolymerans TaxID=392408 RepID=A0ABN1CCR2_9DEIO
MNRIVTLLSAALFATLTAPAAAAAKATPATTRYQPYTRAAFDAARGTQRVLFFAASWCPNCRAADADIAGNLARVPAGVTIFKTDYDREGALKKQYGITYQHTFVLVDRDGKALKKWAGGKLDQILANTRK